MRKQLVSKYEARQRNQRSEFGRDVAQQARAAPDLQDRAGGERDSRQQIGVEVVGMQAAAVSYPQFIDHLAGLIS